MASSSSLFDGVAASSDRTILVVDDDAEIRIGISQVLRDEGYNVHAVANGAEALEAIARQRPKLVLLDLMMPVMTGQDVLRVIKETGQDVPIVIMTAAPHANTVPGLPVMVKPLSLDNVLKAAYVYARS